MDTICNNTATINLFVPYQFPLRLSISVTGYALVDGVSRGRLLIRGPGNKRDAVLDTATYTTIDTINNRYIVEVPLTDEDYGAIEEGKPYSWSFTADETVFRLQGSFKLLYDTGDVPGEYGNINVAVTDCNIDVVVIGCVDASNAPGYEDLNFDIDAAGGPAATLPDYVNVNNVIYRAFEKSKNQKVASVKELPHSTNVMEKLWPHMHCFLVPGQSPGTTGVEFTLWWELRGKAGTQSGSVVFAASAADLTANPNENDLEDTIGIEIENKFPEQQLAVVLQRTGGDAGDVVVTTYGFHYQVDKFGTEDLE